MPAVDSFSARTTSISLNTPTDVTGLERIMLAAQGDLQRILSAFFARPIAVNRIYARTSSREHLASPEQPITQERQVHLLCAERVVCIATSRVTLTTPECAHLFLDEGFAIGQMFRRMQRMPTFELLSVNTAVRAGGRRELRRVYKLSTEGFDTEIEEVFPDRDMFVRGEAWLTDDSKPANLLSERKSNWDLEGSTPSVIIKFTPGSVWSWFSRRLSLWIF